MLLVITGPCLSSFAVKLREVCKNIDNVKLHLVFVFYEEIITETINAHLLIGLYEPAVPNNRFASPNKLFEVMMCSKPIIANARSPMADIMRKDNCDLVVPYGDTQAVRQTAVKLEGDVGLRQRLGASGKTACEEEYSWRIMEQRL